MANAWFRMYAEFSHDPKVQMLSEAMQRRYVMLMCLRCSNVLETLHETELAFQLRISDTDLASTKSDFVTRGFIDTNWNLLHWEKRQFSSDSSTERVSRYRNKLKQNGNVTETVSKRKSNGLDSDSDTEVKTNGQPDGFDAFWEAYPRKQNKPKARLAWKKLGHVNGLLPTLLQAISMQKQGEQWSKGIIPHASTWLNNERWLDEFSPAKQVWEMP